ncbi:uncharacterized protein Yka (UPF0111/DUF47 family) [Halorubrum alkaliphilum]|uniref:Uncharacterized protein Yka (UPF0111/DUF47 family) n=1 Tax=Halorubrum alkaliphilum TaxID=261290 RepID=A0A8T4GBH9_9EURY|nr:DUF47 family protein [Halorubrum alkaliphilum]MBP1921187.1 uncharacterized protein Yka (UPF0111/DUF47 family) [Halorubrum alkaliphilum]
MTDDADFGDRLESRTETYLDRLNDCIEHLPEAFDRYEADAEYRETVERIGAIESECDELNREITGSITDSGPEEMGLLNTRINFNAASLIELYNDLDVIANHTERITQELAMTRPEHGTAPFDGLAEMAAETVEMASALQGVVERFVHGLTVPNATVTLVEGIETVQNGESRCDAIRDEVIETAFDDGRTADALLYREFAILLDELANTMEDVTDRIVVIASDEPGIVTEP